jgi:L-alanine-DL-glutamate epimerase-like enolase superfamily enzyme
MDVMLEGHGMWQPAAAERILRAVRHVRILWAEDITLANNPGALRRLADRTGAPLSVSEYLLDRWQYRSVLESGAVSYLHLDPSWCGGITESQRIVSVASAFDVVCAIHDCTGPLNLLAGLHLGAANVNVGYQEVLRSFLGEVYPTMVDTEWRLVGGRLRPPATPGLGAELTEEFLASPDLVIERSVP